MAAKVRRTANKVSLHKACANKGDFISFDDPLGSYTGTPLGIGERPIQDVDDL